MAVGVQIVGIAPSDNSGYTPTGGSQVDFTPGGQLIVDCILTLTGNYGGGATHGDAINFGTTVAGSLDFPSGQAPSLVGLSRTGGGWRCRLRLRVRLPPRPHAGGSDAERWSAVHYWRCNRFSGWVE